VRRVSDWVPLDGRVEVDEDDSIASYEDVIWLQISVERGGRDVGQIMQDGCSDRFHRFAFTRTRPLGEVRGQPEVFPMVFTRLMAQNRQLVLIERGRGARGGSHGFGRASLVEEELAQRDSGGLLERKHT